MNKEKISLPEQISPLKAVYCYYFPEVRRIVDKVVSNYPHETFLQSVYPGLDDFHKPVIESYLNHFQNQLPALKDFPYQYVTSGANEGIFHLLSKIATQQPNTPLYTLEGEYEGFAGYGQNLGLTFSSLPEIDDLVSQKPGVIFLSNPSARDGNIIPNEQIIALCEAGHQIIYDATYVGLTDPHQFELNHPNILATLISLSKPFGLYYYRVGFTFTRFAMPTLEVNKWFKNIFSLTVAKEVLDQIGETELVDRYRPTQNQALKTVTQQLHFQPQSSDVILLGSSPTDATPSGLETFNRRHNYRFCLTPYFLDQERSRS